MLDLVRDIKELIDRYGYEAVDATVQFVHTFPAVNTMRIGYNDVFVNIEPADYYTLRDYVRSNNRIGAIKFLREKTHIGLREAKDIVENNF